MISEMCVMLHAGVAAVTTSNSIGLSGFIVCFVSCVGYYYCSEILLCHHRHEQYAAVAVLSFMVFDPGVFIRLVKWVRLLTHFSSTSL